MEAPKKVYVDVSEYGLPEKVWAGGDVEGCVEYVKADLAQAPAPALWTQAQQLAFARAYDAEDAAQRGEPTPWVDGEDTGEWVDERLACVRAGLAALEPDAGVVAELVEALRKARHGLDWAKTHLADYGRDSVMVNGAAADVAAALAKLGVR